MILLVLIAVLWVVVLAPSVVRRFTESARESAPSTTSTTSCELLQHAGPKSVNAGLPPAIRRGPGRSGRPGYRHVLESSRPRLVVVRRRGGWPVDRSAPISMVAHYEQGRGDRGARDPPVSPSQTDRPELAAYRRQQARQRCTLVLRLLLRPPPSRTGILGFTAVAPPGLGLHRDHWPDCPPSALVGLIAYARDVEGQRRQSGARVQDSTVVGRRSSAGPGRSSYDEDAFRRGYRGGPSRAFPGAWDEDQDDEESFDCAEFLPPRRAATGGFHPHVATAGRPEVSRALPPVTILGARRGCSSAGRALRSQCRGRGFESHHLHQRKPRSPG